MLAVDHWRRRGKWPSPQAPTPGPRNRPEPREMVPHQGRQADRDRQRGRDDGWPHTTVLILSEHTAVGLSKHRLHSICSLFVLPLLSHMWIYGDVFKYDPIGCKASTKTIQMYSDELQCPIYRCTAWGCYWWDGKRSVSCQPLIHLKNIRPIKTKIM